MLNSHFFIGVDSDGTAFDSMNLKHLQAFIPAAEAIWSFEGDEALFAQTEREVNLTSALRGINRFPGLLEVFQRMRTQKTSHVPDLQDFSAYIQAETIYSNATLKAWIASHPSAELEKVLQWSLLSDQLFAQACEHIRPFPHTAQALKAASEKAVVGVISSASSESISRDWKNCGLLPFVDVLMSQQDGNKREQLRTAMSRCCAPVSALMLGDTLGDAKAAQEAGARFYPIVPGTEDADWVRFEREILPAFLAGRYGDEEEKMEILRLQR